MCKFVNAGYIAIPIAFLVHFGFGRGKPWEPTATFTLAAVGTIPLAALIGQATEHLAQISGPTWGGLLNATFGNAAELIIGIIGLTRGLTDVVKASLTGSILGNLLLVGGGAMVVGGWRREKQTFSAAAAQSNGGMLALAAASMLMPAIFHYTEERLGDPAKAAHEHAVSIGTCAILMVVYLLGLLFTLRTHKHIFSPPPRRRAQGVPSSSARSQWSLKKSLLLLLVASVGVAVVAELLIGSVGAMAEHMSMNRIFVGVILLAVIGNAAEHSTAFTLALHDDMDTAMSITHQSSLQIALFVTPVLVFVSWLFVGAGIQPGAPLEMVFSPLEVVAVVLAVSTVVVLGYDGETNWFEGALLLGLYAILAIAFFYIPTAYAAH